MDKSISRTEQKRRAKEIEQLARELVDLSPAQQAKLPCDDFIRQEIILAGTLKGSARKRQTKYIAKELRHDDPEPLLSFLEETKGSKLKKDREFHELENLRQEILSEAIEAHQRNQMEGLKLDSDWQSDIAATTKNTMPTLDLNTLNQAARRYARSRKPSYSREVFRILQAAKEQTLYK